MTDAERKLWRFLRGLSLAGTHFRRQATIGPFFADFACHQLCLIIEVDGGQHNDPHHAARDALRTQYLNARGYRVLRFWNNDVLHNIDGVCEAILTALETTTPPTPNPSPPQAGGRGRAPCLVATSVRSHSIGATIELLRSKTRPTVMTTWIILIVVAVAAVTAIVVFNRLVSTRQMANEAWSGIDVQLKRRAELVPNLVEVVKGYAAHERGLLDDITRLRGQAGSLPREDVAQRAQVEGALTVALGRLMALAESYPDLKASRNFLELQQQLSTLENELQMARRYYNGAARNQNVLVQSFPSNVIAGLFGFHERPFFELSSDAERAVPQVALGPS